MSNDYVNYVLEQLTRLGDVDARRMFGGWGLYCDDLFIGLIFGDTLYLKVDDTNRADYEARGMARFQPYADRPTLSMNYYETPAEVLEDSDQLIVWARRSLSIAAASPPKPKKRAKAKAAKAPKAKRASPRAPAPKKQPKRVTRKSR